MARTKEAVLVVEKHEHAVVSYGPHTEDHPVNRWCYVGTRHFLPTSLDKWMADTIADECGSSNAPPNRRVLVEQPASEHARTKSKVDLAQVASSQHT